MNVVLLEERGKGAPVLAERLGAAGCRVLARLQDLRALEEALGQHTADIIVLDLPFPDRALVEKVGALARIHARPVAVFVEETDPAAIRVALRAGITSYVVRGTHADRVRDVLEVARARFVEERALREQLASARSSLVERKLIERAKGLLVKQMGFDEQQAYDAMRKIAMRRNCRIAEVARAVLEGDPT